MNINEILNYQKPKETLYEILGCDQSSSIDQICKEYKIRALQLHPDKNVGDPECLEKFKQVQAAKEILTNASTRKSYDCWLNSRIQIPFEQWVNRKQHMMHWAAPRSSNLSIIGDSLKGQGSDLMSNNNNNDEIRQKKISSTRDEDWLGKFRNYEI